MVDLSRVRPVECKTIDGTLIAGNLYAVEGTAPAIIMSHGVRFLVALDSLPNMSMSCECGAYNSTQFNCIKEMALPEVAEAFQSAGYNVLLYDARSVGASGGKPRNLVNPLQMAEDLSGECNGGGGHQSCYA